MPPRPTTTLLITRMTSLDDWLPRRLRPLANEASGRRGRASPSGSACDHRCYSRASLVLAGRALRVPVATVPHGPPRTTAIDGKRLDLRHRRSIPAAWSPGTRLPSSGPWATLGPRTIGNRGSPADNSGKQTSRSEQVPAHRRRSKERPFGSLKATVPRLTIQASERGPRPPERFTPPARSCF